MDNYKQYNEFNELVNSIKNKKELENDFLSYLEENKSVNFNNIINNFLKEYYIENINDSVLDIKERKLLIQNLYKNFFEAINIKKNIELVNKKYFIDNNVHIIEKEYFFLKTLLTLNIIHKDVLLNIFKNNYKKFELLNTTNNTYMFVFVKEYKKELNDFIEHGKALNEKDIISNNINIKKEVLKKINKL